jgi:glycosyltransferase involved in cell wall biosynthesis
MDSILVSIITPTYNHEEFIAKCIESVLSQSYQYWEQIIIDDGSNDNTGKIVASYKDKRIKYIKQKNKGIWKLNETYNKALRYSNGEIIAILEGDDFWPKEKLENQISAFNDPEVILTWGKANVTDTRNDIIGYRPKSIDWIKRMSDKDIIKSLLFGNFIPACTVMCRKNVLMDIQGFKQVDHVPYVDYTTWLRISLKGKFVYLDEILGYWRHHEKQISVNMSLEMFESMKYSIEFFKCICKKQNYFNELNITDLIIYDLNQAKYNFLYLLKTHSTKKNENVSKLTNVRSSIKLKELLNIFYTISKINIIWLIILLKKRC